MDFNFGVARERAVQQVLMFNRYVPTAHAITVSDELTADRLVTTFMVNNYSTNSASVFLGVDPGMHSTIEIVPGACPVFTTWQEGRQMYELQVLLFKMLGSMAPDLIKIPVICWDLTKWWLIAGEEKEPSGSSSGDEAETVEVVVTAFPLPYL